MTAYGRLLALAVLLFACGAGAAVLPAPCAAVADSAAPCVDKVDPPNWWIDLPSPMLLLHGQRLQGAHFSISGAGVSIAKSQVSANGHYAFLWLTESSTAAQTLVIRITALSGSATVTFPLEQRRPAPHSGFSPSDVMYLIMTDRFADGDPSNDPQPSERSLARGWHGGDFRGIEQHLNYLQQLGVTTVWTTPVYDNDGGSQAYHGYSATNLYRTDPHFGTLADLQHLSDAMHRRGMKLVLDTVPNHVGAANAWADDPPAPDWFHGTRALHSVATGAFQALIDPHATWQQRRAVTEGWFANVLPDLNQENPLVRQYLIQNVIWWVESTGADGLRYDTFPYVSRAFWHDLDGELRVLYPHLTTVGEVFNPDPAITSFFAGGVSHEGIDTGLTTPFDFPTYFGLRAAITHAEAAAGGTNRREGFARLENVLSQDWLYPHPERLVIFLGNHDTVRFLSQSGATVADLKMGFALLATLRGMPQIYSGDEIAMRGGEDPDNRHDFPGGFAGDPQNAFTAAGRTPEQAEVHDWVASLFQFRERHPVLSSGEQQDLLYDDSAFIFVRTPDLHQGCGAGAGEHFLIAVNDSDQTRALTLDLKRTALEGCTIFTGKLGSQTVVHATGTQVTLSLSAKQVILYQAQ